MKRVEKPLGLAGRRCGAFLLVVTPTRGAGPYLKATIESVAGLSVPHEHVLVVPESGLESLQGFSTECTLLKEPGHGRGMYHAINAALTAARSPWTHFTYINDDDLLHPEAGKHWSSILESHDSSPLAVYGKVNIIDEDGRAVGRYPVSRFPSMASWLWQAGKVPFTQHGLIVNRKAYEQVGSFDSSYRYAADMDYLVRLTRSGCDLRFTNDRVASFRINRGQLSSHTSAMADEIARIRKGFGYPEKPRGAKLLATTFLGATDPVSYLWHLRRFGFAPRDRVFQSK